MGEYSYVLHKGENSSARHKSGTIHKGVLGREVQRVETMHAESEIGK